LAAASLPVQSARQQITPAPAGPLRVDGNHILDAHNRMFLMRGTQLPEFRLDTAARHTASGTVFGSYSATSLAAIRLRFNMNTVRVPVSVADSAQPGYFDELAKLVQRANQSELLVVLAAREAGLGLPARSTVEFWSRCAAYFKDYPNLMFDAFSEPVPGENAHSPEGWQLWRDAMQSAVRAIRATGATQPIVAAAWNDGRMFEGAAEAALLKDPNVVYEASPRYLDTRTDADRDAQFGFLARRAPVLANGWDLELNDTNACAAIPTDPSAAAALIRGNLEYFDAHQISWTVSVFEPGKLVKDLAYHDATSLEDGWTCGQPTYPQAGIGRVIEAHMRGTEERGLFVVSAAGGVDLPRGGYAIAYGPVMADQDSQSKGGPHLPTTLGKLSVEVTDARGVTRRAGIYWASAGWGQVNYVVPAESAPGPAMMTIVRADGSRTSAPITIADTAPGLWAKVSCRGPAKGTFVRSSADGRASGSLLYQCVNGDCKTAPIPVANGSVVTMRLEGSGFRYAASAADIELTIGGIRVPVISYGSSSEAGMDQVTVAIPASLRGLGEADVLCRLNGRVSNPVRIYIGGEKPAS
jgi:uncharacterized protein (TIGR03437 family)